MLFPTIFTVTFIVAETLELPFDVALNVSVSEETEVSVGTDTVTWTIRSFPLITLLTV